MTAAQFVALLNSACRTDIEAADLYDYPTPGALAEYAAACLTGSRPPKPLSEQAVPAGLAAAATAPRADSGDVLEVLLEQLARTLCCDVWDIDSEATFRSLGLTPLPAAEFLAFVNDAYRLGARPAVLFDHPTPAALAAHITAHIAAGAATGPSAASSR